jgi:crotonyl-CoA reductase
VVPPISAVFDLDGTGEAAYQMHHNRHEGKIGVLCLAEREGLGVTDPEFRARVGEDRLTIFRRYA